LDAWSTVVQFLRLSIKFVDVDVLNYAADHIRFKFNNYDHPPGDVRNQLRTETFQFTRSVPGWQNRKSL
jgi:hypothetical protein